MSLSPDHPDPACHDCRGKGCVRPPWAPETDLLCRIPCSTCKAREYDATCADGRVATLTPGHACSLCGEPPEKHERLKYCEHGVLPHQCLCSLTTMWRKALRDVLAALPCCTHPRLDGSGGRCGRPAVVSDRNNLSHRCEECVCDTWRKHRVDADDSGARERALHTAIALLAAYDAKESAR